MILIRGKGGGGGEGVGRGRDEEMPFSVKCHRQFRDFSSFVT